MKTLQEIRSLIASGVSSEEAITLLDAYIQANPRDDEALTMRGMIYWSMNKRSKAINDYLAAIDTNPDSKARMTLKSANDILDYYNKDLYNP